MLLVTVLAATPVTPPAGAQEERRIATAEDPGELIEHLRAERDAMASGHPVYHVSAAAEPCLILRSSPGGDEVDCLQPGTELTLLGLEGEWSLVSQGESGGAWVRFDFIEPAPAASGSRARMATDLAAARQANVELRERLETAEASLAAAWEAQMTLSARLLEAQAAGESSAGDLQSFASSVDELTRERDTLAATVDSLTEEQDRLRAEIARLAESERELGRRLAHTSAAIESAGIAYAVDSRAQPCLNVRPVPGSTERIDCLPAGTKLELLELDDKWARIRLPEGVEGWATRDFLRPIRVSSEEKRRLDEALGQLEHLRSTTHGYVERLEAAEGERARLAAELADKEVETARLRAGAESSDVESGRLAAEVDQLARQRSELQRQLADARGEMERLAALEAERDSLRSRLDDTDSRLDRARAELEEVRTAAAARVTQLETDLEATADRFAEAETGSAGLTDRVAKLEAALERSGTEAAASRRAAQAELDRLGLELDSWRQKAAEGEARVAEMARLREQLEQSGAAVTERERAARDEIARLRAELEAASGRAEQSEARERDSSRRAQLLTARVLDLENEIERAAALRAESDDAADSELAELRAELETTRRSAAAGEAREAEAALRTDALAARVRELESELEQAGAMVAQRDDEAQRQVTELRGELDRSRQRVADSEAREREAAERAEALTDRIAELEGQVETVRGSWREVAHEAESRQTELTVRIAQLESELELARAGGDARDEAARRRNDELQAEIESWRGRAFEADRRAGEAAGRSTELESEIASWREREAQTRAALEAARVETETARADAEAAGARLREANRALALGGSTWVVTERAKPCLNLRPERGSGAPRDCLDAGVRLSVLELDSEWARARLDDGIEGWLARDFIEPSPATPAELEALEAARGELAASRARIEALGSELGSAREELQAVRGSEADLRSRLELTTSQGDAELAQLSSKLEATERALAEERRDREAIATRLDAATGEAESLRRERELEIAALDALQQRWAEAAEGRDLVHGELAEQRASIQELERRIEKVTADRDDLAGQLAEERRAREGLVAELESTAQSRGARDDRIAALDAELETLRRDLQAARGDNTALQRELADADIVRERLARAQTRIQSLEGRLEANAVGQPRRAETSLAATAVRSETDGGAETATTDGVGSEIVTAEIEATAPTLPEPAEPTDVEPPSGVESMADPLELARLTGEWARAWSEQRIDDYLGFYAASFTPASGTSRADWAAQRRQRLAAPSFIQVRLDEVETTVESPLRVTVSFVQAYRSNTYADTVRKTLTWAREDEAWKIVGEVSQPSG